MEIHEAADIYPLDEEHLDALAADIKANGLIDDIETLDGKVLDGRRRLLACARVGVPPRFKAVTTPDPITYVLSKQNRRDLTPSQRSMCGARAGKLRAKYEAEAKERQKERKGNQPGATKENLPDLSSGQTRDQIGKLVGVSGKTIDYATRVLEHGVPELVKAVDEGRMAVSTAAVLSADPPEVQRREAVFDSSRGRKRGRKYTTGAKPTRSHHEKNGTEGPRPQWAEVTELLARVASLVEGLGSSKEEQEPWKLVESMESTASVLLRTAKALRRRHHL